MTPAELETQEAILRAAAELFAERGYRGTTTRALAERAGVNEVTIFRRFKNKQGVLAALAASFAERSAGIAVAGTPDPKTRAPPCATLRPRRRRRPRSSAPSPCA